MVINMVNVVIGVITKQDKILLIKRERGDFIGLWGIPGGKVEESEHFDTAIEREIKEELGLILKFNRLLGTATEIMHDKESTTILQICELVMDENQEILNPEFEYKWFSKEEFKNSSQEEKNMRLSSIIDLIVANDDIEIKLKMSFKDFIESSQNKALKEDKTS